MLKNDKGEGHVLLRDVPCLYIGGFDGSKSPKIVESNILQNLNNIDKITGKVVTDFDYLGRGLKRPWDLWDNVRDDIKELGVDSVYTLL